MEPIITDLTAMNAVGIELRTNNTVEMNPSKAKIPDHWKRYFQEEIPGRIPNIKPHAVPLGIYTGYESDDQGEYSLIAGIETTDLHSIPKGMRGVIIPGGKYLVFAATGQMPDALIETWGQIWNYFSRNPGYRRIYTTDFEQYPNDQTVKIYIAVK